MSTPTARARRTYEPTTVRLLLGAARLPDAPECEHCDGADSDGLVRTDKLLGRVCKSCDSRFDDEDLGAELVAAAIGGAS